MPRSAHGGVVAVIPARFGSTRFPGKPLVELDGQPMVVRVARRVAACDRFARVLVATDDDRIEAAVAAAGIDCVRTPSDCASGTDRVAVAVRAAGLGDARLVVNVQGDEPLIDPEDLAALIDETLAAGTDMGTLARPLDPARLHDPNVVKAVVSHRGRALYFSRAAVPHGADAHGAGADVVPPLQHVGLYAYLPPVLEALAAAPPSPLERAERLEQLRALELGLTMHVALARSTAPTIAVDVPEDVERVVRALRALPPSPE